MPTSTIDLGHGSTGGGVNGSIGYYGHRFQVSAAVKATALRIALWNYGGSSLNGVISIWRVSDQARMTSVSVNSGQLDGWYQYDCPDVDLAANTDYILSVYGLPFYYNSGDPNGSLHTHAGNSVNLTLSQSAWRSESNSGGDVYPSREISGGLEIGIGLVVSTLDPPPPVSSVSVSVTAGDSATVSWPAVTDPNGDPVQYWVDYESSATSRVRVVNNTTATSAVVNLAGYPASNNARFYVLSGEVPDVGRYGGWTVSADFVLNKPPTVPTPNTGGAVSAQNPTLSVTSTDPNGNNYRAYFQIATDSGFTNIVDQGYGNTVASGVASTRRGAVLNPSSTYYYRALSEDTSGEQSGYSGGTSITTPAALTATYGYTGGQQTFAVPAGVTSVTLDAYGAQGGADFNGNGGGLGGRATCTVAVTPGETLYLYVGGQGGAYQTTAPGYNGGGTGGGNGGDGGGATDVRRGGTALTDRVVVAAGGGGRGAHNFQATSGPVGGDGGGLVGGDGGDDQEGVNSGGFGGTQSAGGAGGYATDGVSGGAGSLGVGGSGGGTTRGGGGGGGGYYGGGGGHGTYVSGNSAGGGGGGSSLVTGTNTSTTAAQRTGNGTLTISYPDVVETANSAPTAAPLTPADGSAFNGDDEKTFTWSYSDPNGDAQGGWLLFRRNQSAAGAPTEYWNASAREWQTTTIYNPGAGQSAIMPSNAFPRGTWVWGIKATDIYGATSADQPDLLIYVNGGYAFGS